MKLELLVPTVAPSMNTLRAALVPGLIAGFLSIFTSWFWMGALFHRFQRETPGTWRPEGPRSYLAACLIRFVASLGVACLLTLLFRFHVSSFAPGMTSSLRFALCLWGAVSLPMILEGAVFIRLHPLVILGQLMDWLTTMILACVMTNWWLSR
jgi:hypothetical protein